MFPDEEGHPYRGPGSSFDLKLDELNVMACVQDFHMNEHGKLYEMVIKTKHAGPFSHVAVIPGNHEQIHPYIIHLLGLGVIASTASTIRLIYSV